jgi:hypothetical protein
MSCQCCLTYLTTQQIMILASFSYIGHRNYMVKVFVNHIYYNIKYYPWSHFLDLDIFL